MPDIIQLLPDSVANQIAAGEVIQRPASVVKELVENSVDAGANEVHLVVKDSGKTLVQVTDNGCGMSETDARLSLERHATSKIREATDLFGIRTMGFRGEAMASIAAIAQMDLKSRPVENDLGSHLRVEASKVVSQEPVSMAPGTTIQVKNLFFNIPARRKFLKSDPVETRHIIDEFQRVALPNPEITFSMHHNGNEVFHLPKGSFRQRIVGIFGKKHNQNLVPVEETTNIVTINGFVGKPEWAKKTRGEQFFFVNQRFIKSHFLHHAIQQAFEDLIPKGHHPSYFLLLELDPKGIDINIHPTKTEIKFEDEKAIYAIIRSAVKRSLGKYNIAPSLDFERESSFDNVPPPRPGQAIKAPEIKVDPNYNPFRTAEKNTGYMPTMPPKNPLEQRNIKHWEKLFDHDTVVAPSSNTPDLPTTGMAFPPAETGSKETPDTSRQAAFQLHQRYLVTSLKSGMMLIDQQKAHERILFEHYLKALQQGSGACQQLLFPQNLEFSTTDALLVTELLEDIGSMGFDLRSFGKNSFILQGVPADLTEQEPRPLLEGLLEHYKNHQSDLKLERRENLARSLARQASIRPGQLLEPSEMQALIDNLFACEMPYSSPSGSPTLITLTLDELEKRFE
ncbi:MAG: DNA mismatch repair endonuclease MutL [Salibacteraceae bacterium]